MSLNIQRNNELNAIFDKLARVDSNDKKRDKFFKRNEKNTNKKKKEK